jgi:hypothetical protein
MNRAIIVVCSDLHGGHRHGLLNPDTVLEETDEEGNILDEYHPELTPIQEYLWGEYTQDINKIKSIIGDDPLYIIFNGDMTAGNKYHQLLVSDRMADQFVIAKYNCKPWYALSPRAVRIVTGTGAHVFNEGTSEIVLRALLQAEYPNVSTKVMDHGLLNIAGIENDISHHGPVAGSREWLKGNEARYYLKSAMQQEINAGKTPPRIYWRGHYHEDVEETVIVKANGNRYKSTIIVTPSFAFIDNHSRQAVKSPARITHGIFAVEIADGELLRTIPITKTLDIRTKERFE